MVRLRAVLAWCLAAAFALLTIDATAAATPTPDTTLARYVASGYDVAAITRVGAQAIGAVDTGRGLLNASRDRSASPPTSARGTSTTPSVTFVATNTVDDLLSSGRQVSGQFPQVGAATANC